MTGRNVRRRSGVHSMNCSHQPIRTLSRTPTMMPKYGSKWVSDTFLYQCHCRLAEGTKGTVHDYSKQMFLEQTHKIDR